MDRFAVQHAAQDLCTNMAKPTQESWTEESRETPDFDEGDLGDATGRHEGLRVDVRADSDWARGPERKAASGGIPRISGEALVKDACDTRVERSRVTVLWLGRQSLLFDLGLKAEVRTWTDSNAA